MINRNVRIITVTTLYLTLVAMTTEMYEADAAAILSEYETSTNPTDNTSGADYEEEVTTITESFMDTDSNFHDISNTSSEIFASGFDISHYQNNCTEDYAYENTTVFRHVSCTGEFLHHLGSMALDLRKEFHVLLKTAMRFTCTADETLGHDIICMSRTYVQRCKEFLVNVSVSTADQNTAAVDQTGAFDPEVYETSMLYAQYVMELAELITEHAKIDAMNNTIITESEEIYFLNKSLVWEIIVPKQEELISLLESCVQRAVNVSKYEEENDFLTVLMSNHTSHFLDVCYWTRLLDNGNETLRRYKEKLFGAQHDQFILYQVKPAVTAIVFVVGIAGNGLLLTIFIRHKETRTFPNSMLMNLTAVDCISLLINLLLEYFRILSTWRLGVPMCKLYYFSRYVFIAVSIYSVVMISVQRFMAVRQLPSGVMCHLGKKTKYVVMATIWAVGFILSVPHALIADVNNGLCYELSFEHFGPVSTTDLIVFCVVPVILVAVFSGLTATRIRRSVCSIPGEGAGQERLRHNRIVSSTILIALAALFVVSYTPDFLFKFLTIQVRIPTTDWQFNMINVVTYYFRFVNCCLNPLVLFVMSKRYRAYMKEYICCGEKKELDAGKSDNTYDTSL
jgi:hypothetical protein